MLALFQRTTAYKISSEHTQGYKKVSTVCKIEILQVTVNKIEVLSSFKLISDDFPPKVPKIAKTVPWFLADVHKDGINFQYIEPYSLKDSILNHCFLKKNHIYAENNGDMTI